MCQLVLTVHCMTTGMFFLLLWLLLLLLLLCCGEARPQLQC